MEAHPSLLEIGHVVKPHGLRGAVVVSLVTNRLERLDPGSVLVGARRDGTAVRLAVERSSAHQNRYIVEFAGCSSIDAAEALRGAVLCAEPLTDPGDDAYFVHELIGSEVIDQHGVVHGVVRAVESNPASDLLVVGDAGYVPLRFVVGRVAGRLVVEVPDGLLG